MGELLFVLLEIFGELLLEAAGEAIIAFGFEAVSAPFKKAQGASRAMSLTGIIVLASLSAGLFHFFLPFPLTKPSRFPGISLILSPALCGASLYLVGKWRALNDRPTTRMATFWGGALFAFVFSLVRFLALRYP